LPFQAAISLAGSGRHGLPLRAVVTASGAVRPWDAAESRLLRIRHHRASVWVCHYPETAWCRLAALAPRSEMLFVQSAAGSRVNFQT
jgi:hypothetical protein